MSRQSKFLSAVAGAVLLLAAGATASNAYVVGPTTPGKWGSPVFGTGATITYSFMGGGIDLSAEGSGPSVDLASFMPAGYKAQIVAAFAAWSAVANLTFIEVPDVGEAFNAAAQLSGDIRIGGHFFDGAGGVLAHGFYPPNNGASAAGDLHFDSGDTWALDFADPGFSIFQVAAHEIGHALGLDHTAVPGSLMNPFYSEAFSGPQADDIAGMQYIYGRPVTVTPTVPVPAALPLLATALGAMGFAGWRRSRAAK